MSNVFFRVLIGGVLVLSVASLGVLARAMTGGTSVTDTDGRAPSVTRVRADVPGGHYGPGHAIGLTVTLDKPARGTLVAYLSSGVAVAMPCVAATCQGEYWVGADHATNALDVLFFSGRLIDAEGNSNEAPQVPAGANLSDGVTLRIGHVATPASVREQAPAAQASRT